MRGEHAGWIAIAMMMAAAGCKKSSDDVVISRIELDDMCRKGFQSACGLKGATIEVRLKDRLEACDKGNANACHDVGHFFYSKERGDATTAMKFYQRACELGEPVGCVSVGNLHENAGQLAEAREMYSRSCYTNDPATSFGCTTLGTLCEKQNDLAEAVRAYETACSLGNSCGHLSALAKSSPEVRDQILAYLEQRCKSDSAKGCFEYGWTLGHYLGRLKEGTELVEKACRMGNDTACEMAADGSIGRHTLGRR